jgi:hypothetical protein
MSDAQHSQEKEALEDAANRLLVVDGIVLGSFAFTEVGMWTTKDGGIIAGPGYTVTFTPTDDCKAAIAAFVSAQQPAPVSPPPPPPPPPPTPPPPPPPPPGNGSAGSGDANPDGTTDQPGAVEPDA